METIEISVNRSLFIKGALYRRIFLIAPLEAQLFTGLSNEVN